MKNTILLLALLTSFQVFAGSFSCTSYGLIDVFVSGNFDEDYTITIIDLPFSESVTSIKDIDIQVTEDYQSFKLKAEGIRDDGDSWFLNIDTENTQGKINMDYRGILKTDSDIFCELN